MLVGDLPAGMQRDAELYAGCVSGAIQQDEYLQLVAEAGFVNVLIQKQKSIDLPEELLKNYLAPDEIETYQQGGRGIFSITIFAGKPLAMATLPSMNVVSESKSCCGPDGCS